ncbi:hypothetical protein TNIN_78561 [Trichonephila inaurata madagascariensis]|uniref:Uncharacterized protein n=1 Tax=Trichonephila inaurata madagascariensis TaxID=2747483 RepID=A0A8X6I2T3_9ARAC|nr:hypothetical protein TNIN_78561 [Trichonephila inaurata madagascariensis]
MRTEEVDGSTAGESGGNKRQTRILRPPCGEDRFAYCFPPSSFPATRLHVPSDEQNCGNSLSAHTKPGDFKEISKYNNIREKIGFALRIMKGNFIAGNYSRLRQMNDKDFIGTVLETKRQSDSQNNL